MGAFGERTESNASRYLRSTFQPSREHAVAKKVLKKGIKCVRTRLAGSVGKLATTHGGDEISQLEPSTGTGLRNNAAQGSRKHKENCAMRPRDVLYSELCALHHGKINRHLADARIKGNRRIPRYLRAARRHRFAYG
ncbi:hypothetical protein TRVL_08036 [Trypanosoma vivax]|nr:hypothetical protein TRVL_08036 [Trypanosoma vivax]